MLFLLAPERRNLTRVGGALVLLGTAVSLVASRLPEVDTLAPDQTADAGQGAAMLAALIVAAAVAGSSPSAPRRRSGARRRTGPAPGRPAPAGGLALACGDRRGGRRRGIRGHAEERSDGSVSASRFRSADSLRYSYWEPR